MSGQGAFGPQQAYSVFEAMRPGPGLSVDRMVCLTYSLDLVAVTAMLISMTGQVDDELEGGPMCLTARTLAVPARPLMKFTIPDAARDRLLRGLDMIGETLDEQDDIAAFEAANRRRISRSRRSAILS